MQAGSHPLSPLETGFLEEALLGGWGCQEGPRVELFVSPSDEVLLALLQGKEKASPPWHRGV